MDILPPVNNVKVTININLPVFALLELYLSYLPQEPTNNKTK